VRLESVVRRIEAVHDLLVHPRLAIPTFQRKVSALGAGDPIAKALQLICDPGFSQFPVYSEGRFAGLLTENGITRWLARAHADHSSSVVDLEDECVRVVLELEETRQSWTFAARTARAEVVSLFIQTPLLEAVLITQRGSKDESLLGIATRWDALKELGR
jgi:predicted transcriptional regulator